MADINGLRAEIEWLREKARKDAKNMHWDAVQLDEKDAEIARLKQDKLLLEGKIQGDDALIAELADALAYSTRFIHEHCADGYPDSESLIQRARDKDHRN